MGNSSGDDDSPDWLRSFQTPTKSALFTLPSPSELSLSDSDPNENGKDRVLDVPDDDDDDDDDDEMPLQERYASVEKKPQVENKRKRGTQSPDTGKKGGGRASKQKTSNKSTKLEEQSNLVWMLLSDSDSCLEASPVRKNNGIHSKESSRQETPQYSDNEKADVTVLEETLKETSKQKSPIEKKTEDQLSTKKKKIDDHVKGENYDDVDVPEEVISAKPAGPYVSSSSLPLVLPEKVQRSKALVECEDESIDLSGDVGAVGRVVITDNEDMLLDLKGTIYKTTILPSRTFCVVSFGQSEAKIEAIMNDFIQLTPQSNVYEAETMVEGTLEGFSFGSEDEAEDLPKATTNQNDQNEGAEEQQNAKGNGNADKKTALGRSKKGKSVAGKPPKKPKKKVQATKKTKAKK